MVQKSFEVEVLLLRLLFGAVAAPELRHVCPCFLELGGEIVALGDCVVEFLVGLVEACGCFLEAGGEGGG